MWGSLKTLIDQWKLCSCGCLLLVLVSCQRHRDPWVYRSIGMDSEILVLIADELTREEQIQISKELSAEIERIECMVSLQRNDSLLCQLNRKRSLEEVNLEFLRILERCYDFHQNTEKLFDVTVQPLWQWYWEQSLLPIDEQEEEIPQDLLDSLGFSKISLKERSITLTHPEVLVTLNGIGQGLVTDAIFDVLIRSGIESALIDAGEFRALGAKEWQVEFRRESSIEGKEIWGSVSLSHGQALAVSSGSGYVFSSLRAQPNHIMHPGGEGLQDAPRGVALLAGDATTADALATSLCLADKMQRTRILAHYNGVRAWFDQD